MNGSVPMPNAAQTQDRLHAHWQHAWAQLALAPPAFLLNALITAWSQPWRHYHTLQHLMECLDTLERERSYAENQAEIALALFFHDAIYALKASDNEAQSAAWAQRELACSGVAAPTIGRINGLILATCHHAAPETRDAQLLVDIDLAILGAAPERFDEYETQIRREYAHIPTTQFQSRRREILTSFLARNVIYQTPGLHARCEARARINLMRAVTQATPG